MSHKELLQWQEYQFKEPFMSDRMEIMLSQMMSLFVNVHLPKDKQTEFTDFMMTYKKPKEEIKPLGIQIKQTMERFLNGS